MTHCPSYQVVVKFIRKAKVHSDCWVDDEVYGSVPMEIFLLSKLDHPNIVRVSAVCLLAFLLTILKIAMNVTIISLRNVQ
jgi:hypothetical protein